MQDSPKPRRKAMSKTLRFEVFKRDRFTCQYCGATPPKVVLQVDHILAVAKGGGNDEGNLITSCQPCNLGKGVRSLSVAPQSLADKAEDVAEREAQLLGYQDILLAKRDRLERECWQVFELLLGESKSVPRDQFTSVQRFIDRLGLIAVLESVDSALRSSARSSSLFRYFCGVCWSKVRELEK
jgi:hypothetical protein